jgi:glycerol kinase
VEAGLVIGVDQGTTSTRAIAFDRRWQPVAHAARPLDTIHPRPGWIELDPDAILATVVDTLASVVDEVGGASRVAAVGLANQGETVVAWDADSGDALAPAIVWGCRRSEPIIERLRSSGTGEAIRSLTGLPLDPYFSASKMTWLLEEVPAVGAAAARGTLRFGTVDAWVTARLGTASPGGITDPSTASRTQLYALETADWHPDLLSWFAIDPRTLPAIVPTAGFAVELRDDRWGGLPLTALACDQQAALAGHGAFDEGDVKATYGTGVFVLANAGRRRAPSAGLETSIAWSLPDGRTDSVLQGGVFAAGALIDWLRDDLGLIDDVATTGPLATSVPDAAGVMVLPALGGLGAPWYRPDARAVIAGLTAAAGRAHVVRATLDGIAHRVADVVDSIADVIGMTSGPIRVDGGLTANRYLLERQADVLGRHVEVASVAETTALGIAGLAAIGAGIASIDDLRAANPIDAVIGPRMSVAERDRERRRWRAFVASAASPAMIGGGPPPT